MSLPLFDYANRGKCVHQVFDNKQRINPQSVYRIATSAMFGETELGEVRFHYSPVAGDHAIGMYDKEGYYCTYCPPIPGASGSRGLGRWVRHPWAEQDRQRLEAFS
jgi:hypothetical protein